MAIEKITDLKQFNARVTKNNKPIIIEFGADWCGTCQMLSKIMVSLLETHKGKIDYFHVDFENTKDVVEMFGVSYLPTYVFLKESKVVDHFTGALSRRAIANKFNQLLSNNLNK